MVATSCEWVLEKARATVKQAVYGVCTGAECVCVPNHAQEPVLTRSQRANSGIVHCGTVDDARRLFDITIVS